MSVNIIPEHALPKSYFIEEELTTGSCITFESAGAVRAELPAARRPASKRLSQAVTDRSTSSGRL
jgi:hypothetical protein